MRFYLSNALVFFIQVMPCAVLVFLAFPEEALRVPRRQVLTGTVLAAGLLFTMLVLTLTSAAVF